MLHVPSKFLIAVKYQIKLPPKTIAICLDEDGINGDQNQNEEQIRDIACPECTVNCLSFKTLKDHYLRQHPGLWPCQETLVGYVRMIYLRYLKVIFRLSIGYCDILITHHIQSTARYVYIRTVLKFRKFTLTHFLPKVS